MHPATPSGIAEIDPHRLADVGPLRMPPPGIYAFQMLIVEIARPPDDLRTAGSKIDHMLAGAATCFENVAGLAVQEALEHRPDRLVIAVKRRCIQAAIRLDRPAVFAELHDIFSHSRRPSS